MITHCLYFLWISALKYVVDTHYEFLQHVLMEIYLEEMIP